MNADKNEVVLSAFIGVHPRLMFFGALAADYG